MVIDILLLLFMIAGFWLGYTKGIVATLFSVFEYLIASLITVALAPFLSSWLISTVSMHRFLALLIGTFVFFLTFIFLIKWIFKRIDSSFKKTRLGSSPKVIGGIFMLIVSIFIFSIVIWLVNYYGMVNEKLKMSSHSYPILNSIRNIADQGIEDLKPLFHRYWDLIQNSVSTHQAPVELK